MIELNKIYNDDCMNVLPGISDDFFELAIVDPPFGIGTIWRKNIKAVNREVTSYKNNEIIIEKYLKELFRVSKNQIIWGVNYFWNLFEPTNNLIFWDKGRDVDKTFMSEGELAWTSFKKPFRKIYIQWDGCKKGIETGIKTIHPQQKPINLNKWLLKKYAKPGDKILDTHAGSCSSVIACIDMGFEYLAIEKDKIYYDAAVNRVEEFKVQGILF